MPSIKSYSTALSLLEKVLVYPDQIDDATLFFATGGHISKDGEKIFSEVFFFGVGSDTYSVYLYGDGGEIHRLDVVESWTASTPESHDEEEVVDDEEN